MVKLNLTILFTLSLLFANAQDTTKWYRPKTVSLQFAGDIGMFSLGPGWTFKDEKIEVITALGYVPKLQGDDPIFIASLKGVYTPNLSYTKGSFTLHPVALGTVFSYTLGKRYARYHNRDYYPKGYYWWSVPFRFGLLYKASATLSLENSMVDRLGLYFEASY